MPVLCFFNALYYTDTGSLFYVLLTYYNTLNDSSLAAGITGLVAVLFRQVRTVLGLHYCMHFDLAHQTNIVWVGAFAASMLYRQALRRMDDDSKKVDDAPRECKVYLVHPQPLTHLQIPTC